MREDVLIAALVCFD